MEESATKIEVTGQGSRLYVYAISLVAAVGGFIFGYDLSIVAGAQIYLKQAFEFTPGLFGFAIGSAMLGCVAGPICAGWLADRIGRKRTLIVAALLFAISTIGTALPQTIGQFILFRIVGGVGVGLASIVSPMYIAETAPARIRGRLVTMNQFAIVLGCLTAAIVAFLLAKHVDESVSWRWMFASEGPPILLFVLALSFIPNSPRWLMQKDRSEEALKVLARVDGEQNALGEVKAIRESMSEKTGRFSELFLPGIRIALLIAVALAFFQQWTGASPLISYAPLIFQQAGYDEAEAALFNNVILHIFNIACVILALWLVERLGRRPLLLYGTAGMTLSLAFLGVVFYLELKGFYVLLAMILAMLTYQLSLAPLGWLIMSEIFPQRLRAKGMGVAAVVLWLAAYSSVQAVPSLMAYLEEHFGTPAGVFWLFAFVCVLAYLFSLKMVPETKGKTLEEIAQHWLER